jgi:hypothetical protein
LENSSFSVPLAPLEKSGNNPAISIFILPNNHDDGALEDLCIESVSSYPEITCVHNFMNCIASIRGVNHPHHSKASVQVFLAIEEEGDVSMSTASDKNIWDWNCTAFDQLRQFLMGL